MKSAVKICFLIITILFSFGKSYSQGIKAPGDPPDNTDIPAFFKSKISNIEEEVRNLKTGKVSKVAITPGGIPVYAIFYGEKENFHSQANYNSAIGAMNPAYFAKKDKSSRPVVFFIGPVHGQEVEGIAGLVNLIHVAETGKDYRGKDQTSLKNKLDKCRIIIIPCANPDGRLRCPYNSFVGLPVDLMTKYGQGTHKDGSQWGWPQAKSLHPMKGDVGILGAYFNNDGINIMHDDFFSPMAKETKSIFDIARSEAPDITVSLHSAHDGPEILQTDYLPFYMKKRIYDLAIRLYQRYVKENLARLPEERISKPAVEDEKFPPRSSFNLVSALHHVCGAMSMTFECPHGTVNPLKPGKGVTYDDILNIQLILYEEILDYIISNRLYQE
jgi:hypothetical protein